MNALRKLCVAATTTAAICFSFAADANVKVGDKMPALKVGTLYNNQYDLEMDDLKGFVVVVEFWATWCGPCRAAIPHLNKTYEKYKDQGVVMISLSDENSAKVAPFVKELNTKYIVGDSSTSKNDFGVNGIPHAFLIDPEGIVRWRDHPMNGLDGQISQAIKKYNPTRRLGTGPVWNASQLSKIETALAKRDYANARAYMRNIDLKSIDLDDKKDKVAQRYTKVMSTISRAAEADFVQAVKDADAKRYNEAIASFKKLAEDFDGMPIGKKSADALRNLEKDPTVAKARRGSFNEKLAGNALKRAKGAIRAGDKATAYRRLTAIVNKYDGTQTAEDAAELIAKLEEDKELMAEINGEDGG